MRKPRFHSVSGTNPAIIEWWLERGTAETKRAAKSSMPRKLPGPMSIRLSAGWRRTDDIIQVGGSCAVLSRGRRLSIVCVI